jgi:CRISPR/Cas system-associated exonuclease Cas4 (RecB family)
MKSVSKQIFLNTLVCHTLGWLLRSGEVTRQIIEAELTLGERFRIEQGIEIGRRARKLYPDGLLIDDTGLVSASKKTKSLMNDPSVSIIFEGAFLIDGFVARADVLRRKDKGWRLVEVKSGVNDREEFIDDMAYTAMVIDRCGFDISGVSLFLVSKDFRLGMANENLFIEIDHTREVLVRVEEFKPFWQQIEEITRAPVEPEPQLIFECRKCELFKECLGKDIENHIFNIPRLSQSKFDELTELGIVCIEAIPDSFPLTENQARVRDCVLSKKPFVGGSLKSELASISWPAYYLDFETVMTAIPLYPNIAPYTQIPTQYSIHKCSDVGVIVAHSEYLADPSKDCRRELAENLINGLGEEGSIIVYSNFEKAVINALGRLYPDLSEKLNSLAGRMTDLVAIIQKNFYHPDFHGSASIKVTAPVLVPEISWDNLKIAEGDSAMAAFAYLALGKYKETGEVESVKRNLMDYCKQDTLAMVRLHHRLAEYV